jgi:hypothetical protein
MSSKFSSSARLVRNGGFATGRLIVSRGRMLHPVFFVHFLLTCSFEVVADSSISKFCAASEYIFRMSHAFEVMRFDLDNSRESWKHVLGHLSARIGEAESVVDLSNTLAVTSSLMHQWTSSETPDGLYLGTNSS